MPEVEQRMEQLPRAVAERASGFEVFELLTQVVTVVRDDSLEHADALFHFGKPVDQFRVRRIVAGRGPAQQGQPDQLVDKDDRNERNR
jgi:hypothetical protein